MPKKNISIYCLRCKNHERVVNAKREFDSRGKPRIHAICTKCHNSVYRYIPKGSKGMGFFEDAFDTLGTAWKTVSDVTAPLRKPFFSLVSKLPGAKYLPLDEDDTGRATDWITKNVFGKGLKAKKKGGIIKIV